MRSSRSRNPLTGWVRLDFTLKDKLYEELGIPTLNFEIDAVDRRVTSSDAIKSKLDDFLRLVVKNRG